MHLLLIHDLSSNIMIETVCGSISKDQLGITMSHEHLILDLRAVRSDEESYITDIYEVIAEIMPLKKYHIKSFIELTTNDMGRDVRKLIKISKLTGFHIICATGFYLEAYHSKWLKEASVEEIAELFTKEITIGIAETNVKAGLIGEIATSYNHIYPSEEKVFEAAAKVSSKLGCPISTHCDMGTMGDVQSDLLIKGGVIPDKIILGHMDLNLNLIYHKNLLKKGVNLAFDTVSKTKYNSDEARANHLKKLLDLGYEDHLLLSQDVSRRSYFKKFNNQGYEAVMEYFLDLLRKEHVTETQIEKLLIKNPARILDY